MIRRTFLSLPCAALFAADEPIGWRDIRGFGVEGKGWTDTKHFYDRLPGKAEGVVRPPVWGLSHDSTGMLTRFASNAKRIANRDALIALITARLGERTRDQWIRRLQARDVPAGPVNGIDEVVKDGYLQEAGMLVEMEHASCGRLVTAGIPIRLSATPGKARLPPPMLGQHNHLMRSIEGRASAEKASSRTR